MYKHEHRSVDISLGLYQYHYIISQWRPHSSTTCDTLHTNICYLNIYYIWVLFFIKANIKYLHIGCGLVVRQSVAQFVVSREWGLIGSWVNIFVCIYFHIFMFHIAEGFATTVHPPSSGMLTLTSLNKLFVSQSHVSSLLPSQITVLVPCMESVLLTFTYKLRNTARVFKVHSRSIILYKKHSLFFQFKVQQSKCHNETLEIVPDL